MERGLGPRAEIATFSTLHISSDRVLLLGAYTARHYLVSDLLARTASKLSIPLLLFIHIDIPPDQPPISPLISLFRVQAVG
ncbi:hypothetical protein CDV31_011365 [Fusarium ambrosium]|uniref:Uncharacterized protein n=1 Tax=Fusarium ambrosium TaxID=131363 RepID=A0A428THD2_9HYPO|nr:hypothetical protein CDV31_011365 [Fusarium ambrosium]